MGLIVKKLTCLLLIIGIPNFTGVNGHGMLMDPPNRSSLWKLEEYWYLDLPKNYDDNSLWCGNFTTQWEVNGGRCGVCGDSWSDPVPRDNEDGGTYGLGYIVRSYNSGDIIPIKVILTASHLGYFEIRLCTSDYLEDHLDEECYLQNVLPLVDGWTSQITSETRYEILTKSANQQEFYYYVKLPHGVRCHHCVVQWHYYTGNRWGECEGGHHNATGCGPQETFRGCADIEIL